MKHIKMYMLVILMIEALEACVKLTNRYMTKCFLPDKAINALDEACRFMGSLQMSYDNIIMWIFILMNI